MNKIVTETEQGNNFDHRAISEFFTSSLTSILGNAPYIAFTKHMSSYHWFFLEEKIVILTSQYSTYHNQSFWVYGTS